jgi:hypothetical protein
VPRKEAAVNAPRARPLRDVCVVAAVEEHVVSRHRGHVGRARAPTHDDRVTGEGRHGVENVGIRPADERGERELTVRRGHAREEAIVESAAERRVERSQRRPVGGVRSPDDDRVVAESRHRPSLVDRSPAEVRREREGARRRVQSTAEGIRRRRTALELRVERAGCHREVDRRRDSGQQDRAVGRDRDAANFVVLPAAQIRADAERTPCAVDARDEAVAVAAVTRVERARARREVGRVRAATDPHSAESIECDRHRRVAARAAEERRPGQRLAIGAERGDERVLEREARRRVERSAGERQVRRPRRAGDDHTSGRRHGQRGDVVEIGSAVARRELESRIDADAEVVRRVLHLESDAAATVIDEARAQRPRWVGLRERARCAMHQATGGCVEFERSVVADARRNRTLDAKRETRRVDARRGLDVVRNAFAVRAHDDVDARLDVAIPHARETAQRVDRRADADELSRRGIDIRPRRNGRGEHET